MTPLYFAPMEGLTDVNYRQAHYACFLGVSKYFMPFVSPSASLSYTVRERMDISPLQNAGMPVVPQILCKVPEYFNAMSQAFRDAGYGEVNLNLGCPVGTVTASAASTRATFGASRVTSPARSSNRSGARRGAKRSGTTAS